MARQPHSHPSRPGRPRPPACCAPTPCGVLVLVAALLAMLGPTPGRPAVLPQARPAAHRTVRRRDGLLLITAGPPALVSLAVPQSAAAFGPKKPKQKKKATADYQVVRPVSDKKPRLYTFTLPTTGPLFDLENHTWVDRGDPSPESKGSVFKAKFGTKREQYTTVIAGPLPVNFTQNIRNINFTEGTGIISDIVSGGRTDMEWTDYKELDGGKAVLMHQWAVMETSRQPGDVLLCFQTPETQSELTRVLWPTMRDSLEVGR